MRKWHMTADGKKRLIMVLDAIIIVGVITAAILGALILKRADENSKKTDTNQAATIRQIKNSTQHAENIMTCMGTFFSLTDRAGYRIADPQKCIIVNDDTGDQRTLDTSQFSGMVQQQQHAEQQAPAQGSQSPPPSGQQSGGTSQNTPPPDNRSSLERAADAVVRAASNVVDKLNPLN